MRAGVNPVNCSLFSGTFALHSEKSDSRQLCCIVFLTKMTWGCLGALVGLVDLLYVFAVYVSPPPPPPPPLKVIGFLFFFFFFFFFFGNRSNKKVIGFLKKDVVIQFFCTGESLQTAVMDPWSESWGMTQFLSDVSEEGLWLIVHPHLVFPVSFNTLVYERPIFYSC